MKRYFLKLIAFASLLAVMPYAQAQLKVDISGVGANQIPISIASFADESITGHAISGIIRADLQRSGLFKIIETSEVLSETAPVNLASWKAKGADALVTGSVIKHSDDRIELRYKLADTVRTVDLAVHSVSTQSQFARLAAHKIADDIFEKLTGIRGAFATRIAYVSRSAGEYRLEVADSDGESAFVALRSSEPIISPTWSPDGTKLAYVSFELKKPVVYIQDLANRRRIVAANFKGSNSAPAWSPDGKKLAIALSREGLTQIYLINADGSDVKKLTRSNGIDTEPCFSPDGQSIYFTSDRSGGPQIYKMNLDGADLKRLTYGGSYNISPSVSPDGKMMAYISRREGKFQLHVLDLITSQEQRLTDTSHDESPSFAPNSRYILFATEASGQGSLTVVSIDGSAKYTLSAKASNIREPSWGPFSK